MRALTLFTALILVLLVKDSTTILTQINSTNMNISSQIAYMQSLCGSVPIFSLGLCNTTCEECRSTSPADCGTCSAGYVLNGRYCQLDNSNSHYTYYQYAGISQLKRLQPHHRPDINWSLLLLCNQSKAHHKRHSLLMPKPNMELIRIRISRALQNHRHYSTLLLPHWTHR